MSDSGNNEPVRTYRDAIHLEAFFAGYKNFEFDKTKPAMTELHRLFEQFDWGKESGEARYAHRQLKRALIDQFNAYYGRSMGDVRSWRSLCWAVGIDEIPRFPRECQKLLKPIHVNLIDLIDVQRVDIKVQRFDSVKELEDYTNETDKFFPSHVARGDKLLRWLLRPLHKDREPEPDDNENQKPKSKRNRRKGGKKPGGGTQNDQGGNQDGTPSKRRRRRRRNKKAAAPETPSNPIQPTMSSTST